MYVGLEEDDCRNWLTEYAVDMLSPISRRSKSSIRHSTKSNIKYIYRSEISFACGRENNRFKACCSNTCPVYFNMSSNDGETLAKTLTTHDSTCSTPYSGTSSTSEFKSPSSSVKDTYFEQFEAANQVVQRELVKGTKKLAILNLLKREEMKTRTGRNWTYGILTTEIKKITEKDELNSKTK